MYKFFKNTVRLFMAVVLLGIGVSLSAQDMIVFGDGSIEQVKIIRVGDNEIEYKKWTNQEGPTFSTSKANVFSIKYQDGTEEKVSYVASRHQQTQQPQRVQQQRQAGYAQGPDGGFSIHFGGVFPLGDFKDDDADKWLFDGTSGASVGFSLGFKQKIALPVNGLGIFVSGDIIFNGLAGDVKDMFDDWEDDADVKRPRYLNIPVFVGMNYKYSVSPTFAVWFEGGVGPNFRKITDLEVSETYYGTKYSTKVAFDLATSFGGQIGGGIMINDLFSIGMHYYGLGKTKIKYKMTESSGGYSDTYSDNVKVAQNCFMIRLGFHF